MPPVSKRFGASTIEPLHEQLKACQVEHQGRLIDLGSDGANWRRSYSNYRLQSKNVTERQGNDFLVVERGPIRHEFWLDTARKGMSVSLRVFGRGARGLTVYVDQQRVGSARLVKGKVRVIDLPWAERDLAPGAHSLSVKFWGKKKRDKTEWALAEIDWVRLRVEAGSPKRTSEVDGNYAPPTWHDILAEVVLGDQPRRAVALRADSWVRCPVVLSQSDQVSVALGFWGEGEGAAQVRFLGASGHAEVLVERKVRGGKGATWQMVRVKPTALVERLGVLEFRALGATRGGKVVFGDPSIVRLEHSASMTAPASTVVVIVASSLDRDRLPPWGPTRGLDGLASLGRSSVQFTAHRSPTSTGIGHLGTLLTGRSPNEHRVEDQRSRLPPEIVTLSQIVKEAGVRAAMFTGVPYGFRDFGFARGWDVYEEFSPVRDLSAEAPYLRAAEWLKRAIEEHPNQRRLVVIQVRGAHPPWDLSGSETEALGPKDYSGVLEARRGGITLGGFRSQGHRAKPLLPGDWERLRRFHDASLEKQDKGGLQPLLAVLKRTGAWDDSLVVFQGDVGFDDPPELPFEAEGHLEQDRLTVPLLVKFPHAALGGKEVLQPSLAVDVVKTVLNAFAVVGPDLTGVDLFRIASEPDRNRPLIATLHDQYATQVGRWFLSGRLGERPKLCSLAEDPTCQQSLTDEEGLVASVLWRLTYEVWRGRERPGAVTREAVVPSPETLAALTVWGDLR